jgi:hypothetical protein
MKDKTSAQIEKANIALLKTHHPGIHQLLKSVKGNRYQLDQDETLGCGIEATVESESRRLHFASLPSGEARKWIWSQPLERIGNGIVLALGMGDGMHLGPLVERLPERCDLYLLEPDLHLLAAALKVSDLTTFLERDGVHIFVGSPKDICGNLKEDIHPLRICEYPTAFLVHPDLEWLAPGFAGAINDELTLLANGYMINRQTDLLKSRYVIQNTLENAAQFAAAPGISQLDDVAKKQTLVVVSAGPSLDEALPLLVQYQHRVVTVVVDTALRACLLAGLTPDLVVSLDPTPSNEYHFRNLELPEETFFVAEPMVSPLIWNRIAPRAFTGVSHNDPRVSKPSRVAAVWLESHFNKRGEMFGLGSTSLAAAALAERMGAGSIILVGQDLAYPDRNVYASNSGHPDSKLQSRGDHSVESVGGDQVETSTFLSLVRRDLEGLISSMKAPVYNTSRNGARIAGTVEISLAEALTSARANRDALRKKLQSSLDKFKPSPTNSLVAEIDEELQSSSEMVSPTFRPFLPVLATRSLQEAEKLRMEAQMAGKGVLFRELRAKATRAEEAGLHAAHRELRNQLRRIRTRLLRKSG